MDYKKLYFVLMDKWSVRNYVRVKGDRRENHHIIPKCLGGNNASNNMVCLDFREHLLAHRLLTKIYPNHSGINHAYLKMINVNNVKINSKVYVELKVKALDAIKIGAVKAGKKSGKLTHKYKLGVHAFTETKKREIGLKTYQTKVGIHSQSKEQLSKLGLTYGAKGGDSAYKNAKGIYRIGHTTWSVKGGKIGGNKPEVKASLRKMALESAKISALSNKTREKEHIVTLTLTNNKTIGYKFTRDEAIELGLDFCYDKICKHHPELEGLRWKRSSGGGKYRWRCKLCINEARNSRRALARNVNL